MYRLFAVTAPGLEPYTRLELTKLGFDVQVPLEAEEGDSEVEESGGVEFNANLQDLYRANLQIRTANRILARMGEFFYARTFAELREKAGRLSWEQVLKPGQPLALRVTCHKSRLYHSDAVAERVHGAIADRMGTMGEMVKFVDGDKSGIQLITVRMVNDRCRISVDTSGDLLHRRGYRLETAKAPLRENLAASLIMASGWDANSPLVDPFCGSGTIPIEAALLARGITPGKNRQFAFMQWPNFNREMWLGLIENALAREQAITVPILASDRDAGAIRIATDNAVRAGVVGNIAFSARAFSGVERPAGSAGWVITNPPYGMRVQSSHDLRNLYSRFGDVLRQQFPGWRLGILCESDFLAGHMRIKFEKAIPLVNGGIPVKFFIGSIPGIAHKN
jgi:putative N6-adenine-specific DNA methylase